MKSRNFPKIILLVAVIAILGFILISINPRYCFFQIGKSIKTHDIDLFNKYVDVDSVVEEWVNWSSDKAKQELEDIDTQEKNPIGEGLVNLMMPTMKIKLKEEFKKTIVSGIENTNNDTKLSGMPIINLALLPINNLRIKEKLATIEILHPTTEEKIIFKMRRMPQGYWRLMSIGIPSLMNRSIPVQKTKTRTTTNEPAADLRTIAKGSNQPITENKPQDIPITKSELPITQAGRDFIVNKTIAYAEYYQTVKDKIYRQIPQEFKKSGAGAVNLKLRILANGEIADIKVLDKGTTAKQDLKDLSIKLVKNAYPFPILPEELIHSEQEFEILVNFEP